MALGIVAEARARGKGVEGKEGKGEAVNGVKEAKRYSVGSRCERESAPG